MTPPEPETPLNSDELQCLAQLERQLAGQYPDLAGTLRRGPRRRPVPRVEWFVMAVLAVGLLVLAVATGGIGLAAATLVSIAATGGLVLAGHVVRRRAPTAPAPGRPRRADAD